MLSGVVFVHVAVREENKSKGDFDPDNLSGRQDATEMLQEKQSIACNELTSQ